MSPKFLFPRVLFGLGENLLLCPFLPSLRPLRTAVHSRWSVNQPTTCPVPVPLGLDRTTFNVAGWLSSSFFWILWILDSPSLPIPLLICMWLLLLLLLCPMENPLFESNLTIPFVYIVVVLFRWWGGTPESSHQWSGSSRWYGLSSHRLCTMQRESS